jgi:phosphopantetheinyl transferase
MVHICHKSEIQEALLLEDNQESLGRIWTIKKAVLKASGKGFLSQEYTIVSRHFLRDNGLHYLTYEERKYGVATYRIENNAMCGICHVME